MKRDYEMSRARAACATRRATITLACMVALVGCDDEPRARSSWTAEQVETLTMSGEGQTQLIELDRLPRTAEGVHLWDWWPVRDRSGQPTRIGGEYLAIALSAPADVLPGKRHDIASYRLLSSSDGREWVDRGDLFPEGAALGSRQWAGSTMYDADTGLLHVFYTAAGRADWEEPAPAEPADAGEPADADAPRGPSGGPSGGDYTGDGSLSYEQRMAMVVGMVEREAETFRIAWGPHNVILESDGSLYESTRGTTGGAGQIAGFRDPWYFRHPETNREYILFTANLASSGCDENGAVGMAEAIPGSGLTKWNMLPPLLGATCVNQELERPHFVLHEGRYYLFFSTHAFTFASDLTGPEGLYGFVADSMLGPYRPLNGSGLVLANPEAEPYQAYSWLVLPNLLVTSFVNYVDLDGLDLDAIGDQSEEFQLDRFGGVFAPTVELEVRGDRARIMRQLGPGAIVR